MDKFGKVKWSIMSEKILFSLEECVKCMQTKNLLAKREDIIIYTFPHQISNWDENQIQKAKNHGIFEDLQKTAPILWVDGEKHIGYLRIRKWLQDHKL
jgi:glutaredoxin